MPKFKDEYDERLYHSYGDDTTDELFNEYPWLVLN